MLRVQVGSGGRKVGCQPSTVGEWDHPILLALPDRNRDGDVFQLKRPVRDECEIILEPAFDAG